jgi:hypothetical protein
MDYGFKTEKEQGLFRKFASRRGISHPRLLDLRWAVEIRNRRREREKSRPKQ